MNSSIILYISLVTPIFLLIFFMRREAKNIFYFYILGATICLICGEIDGYILNVSKISRYAMTINITPIVEEIFKATPIIFIALVLKCKSDTVIKSAVSLGIGFAVLETMLVFTENIESVSIGWAIMRGFGAGLVHSLSGILIGFCLNRAREIKGVIFPLTIAALCICILFHSSYNLLVQSKFPYLGLILNIIIYILLIVVYYFNIKKFKIGGKKDEKD